MMIDRVKLLEPGKRIVALKNVTANEPHFPGHFPNRPIMPGVLVTEALAQTSGLLLGLSERLSATQAPTRPKIFFLATTSIKYTHPALPGEVLVLRATSDKSFSGLFRFNVEATVGRNLIASGNLTLAMVEKETPDAPQPPVSVRAVSARQTRFDV
jgi:3-hydroxymyristoyl/3-hydroxydecanoyl-(acyl carrier protein) dehydratase